MRAVLRGVKRLLVSALLIVLAYLCFVGLMRFFQKPTAAQSAALAVLAAPNPDWSGGDAAPALWAMGYDIPESDWAAVLQADIPAVDAPGGGDSDGVPGRGRYPELPKLDSDAPGLCRAGEPCLPLVRSQPDAAAQLLQTHAKRLAQAWSPALLDAGFARYPFKPHFASPVAVRASPMQLVRTQLAQRFLGGDVMGALEGSCRQIGASRRLAARSDSLIAALVANRAAVEHAALLGEMLAELPVEAPLPALCTDALAAMPDAELDLCPAIRTEYRTHVNAFAEFPDTVDFLDHPEGWDSPWVYLFDADMLHARTAPMLAFTCQEAVTQAIAADRDVPNPEVVECSSVEHVADPVGCTLLAVAAPALSQYTERRMDLRAQLQALNLILWLRSQAADPTPLSEKLANRPAQFALPERDLTLVDNERALSLALLQRHGNAERLAIPLPVFAVAAEAVETPGPAP